MCSHSVLDVDLLTLVSLACFTKSSLLLILLTVIRFRSNYSIKLTSGTLD